MSSLIQNLLVSHVVLGLAAIAFFIAVLVSLMRSRLNLALLKVNSLFGLLALIGSWLAGGYYYSVYYGKAVKPIIKSGPFPWIHSLLMETKEHIFLFLPFLAVILVLAIWLISLKDSLQEGLRFKTNIARLTLVIVILGILITLAGAAISGAVNYNI